VTVFDSFVGVGAFLLVAGLAWLCLPQPDQELPVSAAHASHPTLKQPICCTVHNQTDAM
jgi:hypothetical protein